MPLQLHHARPFVGVFKSGFTTDLSIFDNNFPQNGSKNEETAPRTRTEYPHEGPFVAPVNDAALGIILLKGPRRRHFLMSEVPL